MAKNNVVAEGKRLVKGVRILAQLEKQYSALEKQISKIQLINDDESRASAAQLNKVKGLLKKSIEDLRADLLKE
jgi:transposase